MSKSLRVNLDKFSAADYEAFSTAYQNASPYPHLVLEELFPADELRNILNEFGNSSSCRWREYQTALQNKRGTAANTTLPPKTQDYFNFLYSGPFIRFLSRITGIKNLIPDPELHGAGMHEVGSGGRFQIHVDFLKHPRTGLRNRLAVITYLNEKWTEEDGGALELWQLTPPRRVTTVLPVFGRTVIMEQSEVAAHGHPAPVREQRLRRTIIAYFYTADMPIKSENDTLATTYVQHSGYSLSQQAELQLRRVTPRFILDAIKIIHKAFGSLRY
ncbi:MAG: 2OG-Fe(II) oxygenase [Rhodospirillales bacterium]|nr:2OG-Fe(II) oxygenase [Rhodospirillales bacterium]